MYRGCDYSFIQSQPKIKIIIGLHFPACIPALISPATPLCWFNGGVGRPKEGSWSAFVEGWKMDQNGEVHVFRGALFFGPPEHSQTNLKRCGHCARTFWSRFHRLTLKTDVSPHCCCAPGYVAKISEIVLDYATRAHLHTGIINNVWKVVWWVRTSLSFLANSAICGRSS